MAKSLIQPEPTEPFVYRVVTYFGATPEYIRAVICPRCKTLTTDLVTHRDVLHATAPARPTL